MIFYNCAVVLTALMMITLSVHVILYGGFDRERKKWYLLMFSSVIVCAVCEAFAINFDGRADLTTPLYIVTVLQFSLTPYLSVFFAGALGMKKSVRAASAFFFINFILEALSVRCGFIYYFEDGFYKRGPAYIAFEAFYVISLIYLTVSLLRAGKQFKKRDPVTVIMTFVIMTAGIIPSVMLCIYTDYVAVGICSALCYIYYNDLTQQDAKAEIVENREKISSMQKHIISEMAALIEGRGYDGDRVYRTGPINAMLAEKARAEGVYASEITDEFIALLRELTHMHDVGKIVVSDEILKKPGALTPDEYAQVKRHTSEGAAVVRNALSGITDEKYISFATDIAAYHHEKWDGTGYPEGLSGEEIPLCARITAISDVYDALISERVYRKAFSREEAFEIVKDGSGTFFDPRLIEVLEKYKEELFKIG